MSAMPLHKSQPVRSQALRKAADGQSCVRCGVNDGTVVLAHYTGLRQHTYGKGRGTKGDDLVAAELCRDCHEDFDRPGERKSVEASEEFLHCVVLTQRRWYERGLMKLKGAE